MRRSIRTSLLALFLALSLLPLLFIGGFLTWQGFTHEQQHLLTLEHEVGTRAATQLTTFLENAEQELRTVIQTVNVQSREREGKESALAAAIFYRNTFDELILVDQEGREVVRISRLGIVPADRLGSRAGSVEFQEPIRNNRTYYGQVHFSSLSREQLLPMAVPTLDAASGQPNGVLIGEVRLRQILDRVVNTRFGTSGSISLVDDRGIVIAHLDPRLQTGATTYTLPARDGEGRGVSGAEAVVTRTPVTLGERTFHLITELPLAEARALTLATLSVTLPLLLATIILAAGTGIFAVNRLVRPIEDLVRATRRISAGDFGQPIVVTRHDEIGTLQSDFNQMLQNLADQRAAIEERNRELQRSLEARGQLLATVAELSTPLIPVWEGVVVLPVIGHVDPQRGQAIINTLARGVAQQRARVAILDITGMATVDPQAVAVLLQAARTVELLGARAMLAGISARMAPLMVSHGADIGTLRTYRDLRSAIEEAITTPALKAQFL